MGIPADFDKFLVDKKPRNDDELALWIYVCLTRNGLVGHFTRHANPRQPEPASHIDFIADAFFERVGDCIVLGNRKGAKTLLFSTLLLLEALFKPGIELAHLGAIKDQAARCYRYFLKMLKHPLFSQNLAKQPTAVRTEFRNGSVVEILIGTITGVNCLHGDTLIECARDVEKYPDGIPIKELVDKEVVVPTIHEETGEVQYRKAKGLYSGRARCVKVTVKSKDVTGQDKLDEIVCTPEHPFLMLESHKYRKAYTLRPGDRLVSFRQPCGEELHWQMKKFGFTAKQIRENPEAYYENHVVVAVEWIEGEHDVYDLSITPEDGDGDFRHNFPLPLGVWLSNSPHPVKAQLDEVELIDWAVLQEALNMAASMHGYTAATRLTSTRKYSTGTMQKIIDEADKKGFRIYKWNIWDTVEPCRIPQGIESVRFEYMDEDETVQEAYVCPECLRCSLVSTCLGKARYSQGGIIPLSDIKQSHKTLDPEVWMAQVECKKPGTSDLWFPMFNPAHHVIDYEEWLKARGCDISRDYETDGMVVFDKDLPIYAGQDAGFNCPAGVFGQLIDGETVVIFDEVYPHNIAPSVLVQEYLLPKETDYLVEQWFCDPSGLQLMAEMDIAGLLTTKADNAVYPGIELIQSLFSTGRLFIDKRCKNLIWELQHYRKTKTGKVAPNQEDHCLVGDTPIDTIDGPIPIKNLVGKTGTVYCWDEQHQCITTSSFFDVRCTQHAVPVFTVELEDGRTFTGTSQHPVLTQNGWKLLGDLTEEDWIVDGINAN